MLVFTIFGACKKTTSGMKVLYSNHIGSFGGLNFIHNELEKLGVGELLNNNMPTLAAQSKFKWKDLFYSMLSVYYSGGDCVEDVKTVLAHRLGYSPIFKLCSPDTLLKRMKELATGNQRCKTSKGTVEHYYNHNQLLLDINIKLLKQIKAFNPASNVLDYDNTITFTEKADSKMTYKREYGYQPGVCLLNEDYVLFVENRNGNSDAKSFQADTLKRMFDRLEYHGIKKIDKFRADAASHQWEVIELLSQKVNHFYVGARNSYVEKHFPEITDWKKTTDGLNEEIWVGEIVINPFRKHYRSGENIPSYRLLVKKKLRPDAQGNLFTGDAFDYKSVITNDMESSVEDALTFYYHRGVAERQFDVLKNDSGWNNMPFSLLSQNTVFLYFTAMIKNLYVKVLEALSAQYKFISPKLRMKRLIFLLISIPGKWVKRSRQWQLKLYGPPMRR
jgi:hypothetical protein